MRSILRCALLSVIMGMMVQGQAWSAQEKKARPDRPARAKRAVQDQATVQGGGPVNRFMNQLRTLDLTPEQAKVIRALVQKAGPKAKATQEATMTARKGLDQAVFQGADVQAIRPAAQKLTEALTSQAMFQADLIKTVRRQLTAAQRDKLNAGRNRQPKETPAKAKTKTKKARNPQKVRTRAQKNK